MFKKLKKWAAEYNQIQKEINEAGIFVVYHPFGACTHYIEPMAITHINSNDDKQRTISTEDK